MSTRTDQLCTYTTVYRSVRCRCRGRWRRRHGLGARHRPAARASDSTGDDRRDAPTGLYSAAMTRPAADIFAAIASAPTPLTLARAADGFLPLLLADLARASAKRLVYVATDDAAMQAVADAAPFFAPDLIVHRFPARSEEHTSQLPS